MTTDEVEIDLHGQRVKTTCHFRCGLFAVTNERFGIHRRGKFVVTHIPTGYRVTLWHLKKDAIRLARSAQRIFGPFKAMQKNNQNCVKNTRDPKLKAAVKRFKKVRGYERG